MKVQVTFEFDVEDGFTEYEVRKSIREWADAFETVGSFWIHDDRDPNKSQELIVHEFSVVE